MSDITLGIIGSGQLGSMMCQAAKKLNVKMDKVVSNIHKYGNTTAASIPIALAEAVEMKKISTGDIIILAAFGAGFTWASAAIRW